MIENSPRSSNNVESILQEGLLRRELQTLSQAFARAGVDHLFMKGTALAHSLYEHPEQRPRCDTDVIIRESQRETAQEIFFELGYDSTGEASDVAFNYQQAYVKSTGFFHVVIDLHWRISNRPLFADLITFEEAWSRSNACPGLGPSARVFGPVHALVLSLVHPFMHHHGERDPVWDEDQRLLASTFTQVEWLSFWELCRFKRVSRLVMLQLRVLRAAYPGEFDAAFAVLSMMPDHESFEASRLYGTFNKSIAAQKVLDIVFSGSMSGSWLIGRETFFPAPDYMFAKYGISKKASSWLLLPWLYIKRFFR